MVKERLRLAHLGVLLGCNVLVLCAVGLVIVRQAKRHLIGSLYDNSIGVFGAIAVGQLAVLATCFTLTSEGSARRWKIAMLSSITGGLVVAAAVVTTSSRWERHRLGWSFDVAEAFVGAVILFIGFFLLVRITWWPFGRYIRTRLDFHPATVDTRQLPLGSLFCWMTAVATACWLMTQVTVRNMPLAQTVVGGYFVLLLALPLAVPALFACFFRTKVWGAITIALAALFSWIEIEVAKSFPISIPTFSRTAVLFNVIVPTTVFSNFWFLRKIGLKMETL
jgi:hypothetical protein